VKEGTGSVELLCRKIEEDARREVESIISRAEKSAAELRARYSSDAGKVRDEILERARAKADAVRRRTLSGVNLETKRMSLQAREEIIGEVLSMVMDKLEGLRKEDRYRDILKGLLLEAFEALGERETVAIFDEADRDLVDEGFISEVRSHLNELYGDDVSLEVSREFHRSGGGLILRSKDGRVSFDNTFDARLRRMRDSLRLAIVKEVFG